jgi:inner membrane protein
MDNIAHALTGAALGEAGLKRLSGLAMPALIISANLPDIDAITMLTGGSLYWRRGWTHGPPALILLPALLAVALIGFDRWQARRGKRPTDRPRVRIGPLLILCYIGAVSHVLLDLLNTYGVRLLMPFSERWFYGDVLFVVDPWVWIGLGLGVWLTRRREKAGTSRLALPAIGALLGATLYIGAMYAGGRLAEHYTAVEITASGATEPEAILASPVPVNSLKREILVKTASGYRFGDYVWTRSPRLILEAAVVPTEMAGPAVARAAAQSRQLANFLYWSRYPFATIEKSDCTTRVTVNDGRYSRRPEGGPFRTSVFIDGC